MSNLNLAELEGQYRRTKQQQEQLASKPVIGKVVSLLGLDHQRELQ